MKTIAGKQLPPSDKINKVHGSAFHIPLPLQETVKQLSTTDQPIPEHGELYILLHGVPTTKGCLARLCKCEQSIQGTLQT